MLQTESPVFLKPVIVLLRDKVPLRLQVFLGTTPTIIFDLSQNGKDIVRKCYRLFEGTVIYYAKLMITISKYILVFRII
jgi:hypothetical protein